MLSFFDVHCFVLCDLCFSWADAHQVRKADLRGKMAAQHILSPNAKCFTLQITARTNQFTSILYGTPEKTLLFPPNRTKLHFIDLSVKSCCWTNTLREAAAAAGWKEAQVAFKLHQSSLTVKAASRQMEHFSSRTGPEGLPLPWTHRPVSSWQFCAGICTDSRYFGSSDARCHRLFLDPSRKACWVITEGKLLKSFLEADAELVPDINFDYLKFVVRRPWMAPRCPPYLPAKWCRPGVGEDILKPVQLLRGILSPYGWPRPCSLPRGAWIRVTRLSTKLATLPLLFVLMTPQMFQQNPQNVSR